MDAATKWSATGIEDCEGDAAMIETEQTSALKRTLNCLPSKGQIDRKPLHICLGMMGATGPRTRYKGGERRLIYPSNRRPGSGFNQGNLNDWELHDLYIECHKIWIEGCKLIKTHLVENHEAAAKWNALWARIEELLKRKGVDLP